MTRKRNGYKAVREQVADKLRERLETGNIKDLIGNSEYRRYIKAEDTSASIDEKKLEQAALFDGLYILQTNTALPTKEVATAYRDLWQIERAFRNLKSTLELRPMYHWTERRISGHITLCFLALVMQIKFQKLLEESHSEYGYTEVIRALRKVHIVKLGFKDQEHLVRTEVHGAAAMAFKAVGVRVPERVQTAQPIPKKRECSGAPIFHIKRSFIHEGFRIWGVKLELENIKRPTRES